MITRAWIVVPGVAAPGLLVHAEAVLAAPLGRVAVPRARLGTARTAAPAARAPRLPAGPVAVHGWTKMIGKNGRSHFSKYKGQGKKLDSGTKDCLFLPF